MTQPSAALLPAGTKLVGIEVGSLHASPFRDAPLRYRLDGQGWQSAGAGKLEFHGVSEGEHTLDLGYAGAGPSATHTFRFRIAPAPSLIGWWWTLAGVLIAGTAAAGLGRLPALDAIKFRVAKAVFVLRRRFSRRVPDSSPSCAATVKDRSGATVADRYRLEHVISRGGFSAVYSATDMRDNRRVAVKILHRSHRAREDSWIRRRFAHEVAALQCVKHPGVAPILDAWITAAGEPAIAMPFLEGITLRSMLAAGVLNPENAASLILQIGAALAEVHRRGFVHRDIKPENIIVVQPGRQGEQAVLVDFGTAGLRDASDELAATTLLSGSFHYMAPERLTGHYSPATDVFSVGAIVLEMLTGKRLADVGALVCDRGFRAELEAVLRPALGAARRVTEIAKLLSDAPASVPMM
jgi:tRNA A-37 threonylcarbamoyl transferase component Bud32